MQNTMNTPWYKQFWPWFLIFLPATAVVASITTVILAVKYQDSMVVDDYYKEAMQINRNLSKIEFAKKSGLSAKILTENKRLHLELNALDSKLKLSPVVTLYFHHATQKIKDFSLVLLQTDQKNYNNQLAAVYESKKNNEVVSLLEKGIWYVKLLPVDRVWQLNGKIKNKIINIQLSAE